MNKDEICYETETDLRSSMGELKKEMGMRKKEIVSLSSLIPAVTAVFKVNRDELLSRRRQRYLVTPRHVLFALAYKYTVYTLPRLGYMFDRDHTTILHAVDKIRVQRKENPELDILMDEVYMLALENEIKRDEKMEEYREEVSKMIENIQEKRLKESGVYQ